MQMKLIVPIFPRSSNERQILWQEIKGAPLCLALLNTISQHQSSELIVFSDQTDICDYFEREKIETIYHTTPPNSGESLLPFGTQTCVSHLIGTKRVMPSAAITVIDYRAPLLTPEIIRDAQHLFLQSPGWPLVSYTSATENYSNLNAYYRIVYLDTLVLFDSQFDSDLIESGVHWPLHHSHVTRPFYLNWLGFGVMGTNGIYSGVFQQGNSLRMVPAKRLSRASNDQPTKKGNLFLYEDTTTARRIMNQRTSFSNSGKELAGVSAFNLPERADCLILRDPQTSTLQIYINSQLCKTDGELRLWPFWKGEIQPEIVCTTGSSNIQTIGGFRYCEEAPQLLGPLITLSSDTYADGFIVALLEYCEDQGSADFSEPVQSRNTNLMTDLQERMSAANSLGVITDSVAPSDLYEQTGSLAVFKAIDASRIDELISRNTTVGFVLNPPATLRIDSELDLIKLRAMEQRIDIG